MRSLTYSFEDVSLRLFTLTSFSDYYGEGVGTITIKPLTNPTEVLSSADGQTMTLKQAGTRAELTISTPQVSSLAADLLNGYTLDTKIGSQASNFKEGFIRGTGTYIILGFLAYKQAPEIIFTSQGKFMEFTLTAESMNAICF